LFFFSSRRRHTRSKRAGVQTCALPIFIGGGVVGTNAAKQAIGLGANVSIFDLNPVRLKQLTEMFANNANVLMSNPMEIAEAIKDADLAIGSVLIPGAKAPVLVSD